MARHDTTNVEEAHLLAILAACIAKVTAALDPLSPLARGFPMPEYSEEFHNDLKMALDASAKAASALRKYQKRSRGQAEQRSEVATKAAAARWKDKDSKKPAPKGE